MSHSQLTPTLHYKSYENNRGCINLINSPRLWPRTKHIALKYHHFREHVKSKTISVEYIETGDQIADIFTKALAAPQFLKLRSLLTGHESPGWINIKYSGNSTVWEGVLAYIKYAHVQTVLKIKYYLCAHEWAHLIPSKTKNVISNVTSKVWK